MKTRVGIAFFVINFLLKLFCEKFSLDGGKEAKDSLLTIVFGQTDIPSVRVRP